MINLKQYLPIMAAVLLVPLSASAAGQSLWSRGNAFKAVMKSNDTDDKVFGLFDYSTSGTSLFIQGTEHIKANVASWTYNDLFYGFDCVYSYNYGMGGQITETILSTLTTYNPLTWEVIDTNDFGKRKIFYCTSAAFNPADGRLYGCFYNPASAEYEFAIVNPSNQDKTSLTELEFYWNATFFDNKENLYAIDDNGWLYEVDKEDGSLREIGDIGFEPSYDGCAVYDPRSGKAYWAISSQYSSSVVEVDLETAKGVKLFDLDSSKRLVGLSMPEEDVCEGAPNYVADINLSMPEGSLEGVLAFQMPETRIDGSELQYPDGHYRFLINGEVYAEGNADFGSMVELDVKFDAPGKYYLSIVASDDYCDGPASTDIVYIGIDTPASPDNVNVAWENGVFTVNWDAVENSVNNGFIKPEEVSYTVTRFPEELVVATGIKETEFKETFYPNKDGVFYYTVSADFKGNSSEPSRSNDVALKGMCSYDVAVNEVRIPTRVEPGEEFEVVFGVVNQGINPVSGIRVRLYRDGEEIDSRELPELKYNESAEAKFGQTLGLTGNSTYVYEAVAEYDKDENLANNTSDKKELYLHLPVSPTVQNLDVTEAEGVVLTWDIPILDDENVVKEVTEDFEDYESWTTDEFGAWTLIDQDAQEIGEPDIELPLEATRLAYCVIDNSDESIAGNPDFMAHSGNKFAASMWGFDPNDDWLVSPELPLGGQVISFFAKSYVGGKFCETFEVLYSTSGNKAKNFKSLAKFEKIPTEWTEYIVRLPEDARYFAIRCVSFYCNMFFVDDITYIGKGGAYDLIGFNVYRDGERLNDEPIAENRYHDNNVLAGNHEYSVTAVYDSGESIPVCVNMALTSVNKVSDNSMITSGNGIITVSNLCNTPVAIYSVDGKKVVEETVNGTKTFNVEDGIYVVTLESQSYKVIVR